MKRYTKKHLGFHLNIHPVHFHLGMYVATAMILLTAGKGSAEMIHMAYADNSQHGAGESTEMREAETRHDIAVLSSAHFATHSGSE